MRVVHKTDLFKKFDFLVCGPKSIQKSIPKDHCIFVELPEISQSKQFQYVYSGVLMVTQILLLLLWTKNV